MALTQDRAHWGAIGKRMDLNFRYLNKSLWIKVDNRELKEVDHFEYLGSVLTRDGYCTVKIKMRIALPKKNLTEKYHCWQVLISGRNWVGVMLGAFVYIFQRPGLIESWSGSIWIAFKGGGGGEEWRR